VGGEARRPSESGDGPPARAGGREGEGKEGGRGAQRANRAYETK